MVNNNNWIQTIIQHFKPYLTKRHEKKHHYTGLPHMMHAPSLTKTRQHHHRRYFLSQSLVTCFMASILGACKGMLWAYSSLCGLLLLCIPHAYLTHKAFQCTGASRAHTILKNFYQGEITKYLLTGVLTFLLLHNTQLLAFPFFLTYIVGQFTFVCVTIAYPTSSRST